MGLGTLPPDFQEYSPSPCLGAQAAAPAPQLPVAPWPCSYELFQPPLAVLPPGVSKIVTVDVKGNSPLWLKVKDLAEGMTYRFRIRAKTFTYGPEIEANVTTGPGEGRGATC